MSDNQHATVVNGEIHQRDAIENMSLSDPSVMALLLSLSTRYLYCNCQTLVRRVGPGLETPEFSEAMAVEANRFAIGRGGRGGRVARQFVIDLMAKQLLDQEA